jgi:hypothetical protein
VIDAGIDPALVDNASVPSKGELRDAETALTQLDPQDCAHRAINVTACEIVDALPDLGQSPPSPILAANVYDAFRLNVEIDRTGGQTGLRGLVSSAFGEARDLADLVVAPIRSSRGAIRRFGRPGRTGRMGGQSRLRTPGTSATSCRLALLDAVRGI